MLLSYNWLKKYVRLSDSVTAEEVGAKLKLSTVEVEKIDHLGANLENIVVGKVLKAEKHPGADRLKVCEVDLGTEKVTVVCGGSNVYVNELVALAKVGSKVRWHGEGDLIELSPTTIRGVESRGMICASTEIGLGDTFPLKDEKEILDLTNVIPTDSPMRRGVEGSRDSSTSLRGVYPERAGRVERARNDKKWLGQPLAQVLKLNDAVFEIDNKSLSNRPDLWGHWGLAREISTIFKKELLTPKIKKIKEGKGLKIKVKVEDPKLCQRYMAVAMSNLTIAESPDWLKKSLVAVGLRPINNIVDITNYIMYDLGQPLHAFDADNLISKNAKEKTIVVRRAKENEELVTLDEQKYQLNNSNLVIADEDKALALAGVKGGVKSGISETTQTIILESANFDAASIRQTSVKLGLRTDSSARFEKSLDPYLCEVALSRAVEMIEDLCPGAKVISNVADEKHIRMYQGPIDLSPDLFKHKIGVSIPEKNILDILQRLGFEVNQEAGILRVKIPTWRATRDISLAEDLVEEVARIYGYDNIPAELPSFPIVPPLINQQRNLEKQLRDLLVKGLAYTEVFNYSFVSQSGIEKMGDDLNRYVELNNPLSKEKPYLRRHLVTNILENIQKNLEFYPELRLLEIGKVFIAEEPGQRVEANGSELLPRQDTFLTAVFVDKKNKNPFVEARRVGESVLVELGRQFLIQNPTDAQSWQHPARVGEIIVEKQKVGSVYEVNPLVLEKFGLDSNVGVLELNLSLLVELPTVSKKFTPISIFPSVVRDISLVVDKNKNHEEIISHVRQTDSLLTGVELFDVFEGSNVDAQKKSLAYRLIFSHPERTLTTEEVNKAEKKIVKILVDKLGAEVRE